MGEGQRARFRQRNRIALIVSRRRIGIDLVEENVARRGRAQPYRRVRPGHDQRYRPRIP